MNEIEALDRIENLPLKRRLSGPAGYNLLYGNDWQNDENYKLDIEAIKMTDVIAKNAIKNWHTMNPGESAFSAWHSYKRYVICFKGENYVFTERTAMTDRFRAFVNKNFGIHDMQYVDMRLTYLASIIERVHVETRFSFIEKNRFGVSGIYSRLPVGDRIFDMMNETIARYDRHSHASAEPVAKDDGYIPLSILRESRYRIHIPDIKIVTVKELMEKASQEQENYWH